MADQDGMEAATVGFETYEEEGTLPEHIWQEMLAYAEAAEEVQAEYRQIGPVAGGAKHTDPEIMQQAEVEIKAAKLALEHYRECMVEAELLLLVHVEKWVKIGIPVQAVADFSGLKHRSQVYRAINDKLPKTRAEVKALKST